MCEGGATIANSHPTSLDLPTPPLQLHSASAMAGTTPLAAPTMPNPRSGAAAPASTFHHLNHHHHRTSHPPNVESSGHQSATKTRRADEGPPDAAQVAAPYRHHAGKAGRSATRSQEPPRFLAVATSTRLPGPRAMTHAQVKREHEPAASPPPPHHAASLPTHRHHRAAAPAAAPSSAAGRIRRRRALPMPGATRGEEIRPAATFPGGARRFCRAPSGSGEAGGGDLGEESGGARGSPVSPWEDDAGVNVLLNFSALL